MEVGGERPDISLTPSGIGQYINYSGCPRYFRLKFFDQAVVDERNWYDRTTHSGLFAEVGLSFEDAQLETLFERASAVIGDEDEDGDPVTFDDTWAESVVTEDGTESKRPGDRWQYDVRNHSIVLAYNTVLNQSRPLDSSRIGGCSRY